MDYLDAPRGPSLGISRLGGLGLLDDGWVVGGYVKGLLFKKMTT